MNIYVLDEIVTAERQNSIEINTKTKTKNLDKHITQNRKHVTQKNKRIYISFDLDK